MSHLRHPDDLPPDFFTGDAPASQGASGRQRPAIVGMIDAAIPLDGCKNEARSWIASRRGAWIHRACDIIRAHNESIQAKGNGGRCASCGSDAPLMWEPPT